MLKKEFVQGILHGKIGVWVNSRDEVNKILKFIEKEYGRGIISPYISKGKWFTPILLYYSTNFGTFLLNTFNPEFSYVSHQLTFKEFKEITSRRIILTLKETSKLTYLLAKDFYYLVRTVNGSLRAYSKDGSRSTSIEDIDHLGNFDFISSKDFYPYPIKDILEECELKKEVAKTVTTERTEHYIKFSTRDITVLRKGLEELSKINTENSLFSRVTEDLIDKLNKIEYRK